MNQAQNKTPRKTKKYLAAIKLVGRLGFEFYGNNTHDEIYKSLEAHNYFWNPKIGKWEYKEYKPSNSMFSNDNGTATGVIRLRVMAHPHDVKKAIQQIQNMNMKIIDISDPYDNRKGDGVRVYITAVL